MINLAVLRSDSETNLTQDDIEIETNSPAAKAAAADRRSTSSRRHRDVTASVSLDYSYNLQPHVQVEVVKCNYDISMNHDHYKNCPLLSEAVDDRDQ